MKEFVVWLKSAMEDAGMQQRELARLTGLGESYISKLLNGRIIPSGGTIMKILGLFNAHIEIVERRY
jgi:transcriptional regulator with XRE-family HTH domain